MENKKREIVFYSTELSVPYEEVKREMTIKDEFLNKAVCNWVSDLTKENIECWLIEDNIAVTETGYKFCIYRDMIGE